MKLPPMRVLQYQRLHSDHLTGSVLTVLRAETHRNIPHQVATLSRQRITQDAQRYRARKILTTILRHLPLQRTQSLLSGLLTDTQDKVVTSRARTPPKIQRIYRLLQRRLDSLQLFAFPIESHYKNSVRKVHAGRKRNRALRALSPVLSGLIVTNQGTRGIRTHRELQRNQVINRLVTRASQGCSDHSNHARFARLMSGITATETALSAP